MLSVILENLKLVGIAMGLFVGSVAANTLLGVGVVNFAVTRTLVSVARYCNLDGITLMIASNLFLK